MFGYDLLSRCANGTGQAKPFFVALAILSGRMAVSLITTHRREDSEYRQDLVSLSRHVK